MRLRRIMEHMKTQNWFAVGLDFAIAVSHSEQMIFSLLLPETEAV